MAREAGERIGGGQRFEIAPVQRGAQGQVFGAGERRLGAGDGNALGGGLLQAVDQAKSQANRRCFVATNGVRARFRLGLRASVMGYEDRPVTPVA